VNNNRPVVITVIGPGRAGMIPTVLTNSFGFGSIKARLVLSALCTREECPA